MLPWFSHLHADANPPYTSDMAKPADSVKTPKFILLASIGVVLAALYFAQEVLIPLALAALFSFLLAPLVSLLERLRLPRAAAVVVAVLLSFAVLAGIGYVVYNQVSDLRADLPKYQQTIHDKIEKARGPGGMLAWMRSADAEVKQVIKSTASATKQTGSESALPVTIVDSNSEGGPLDLIRPLGSFLLGPLGMAFIVTIFTVFMLLQREDLRDRVIRLVGRNRLTLTTQALDDAAERVSRYLLMQSVVNGSVGTIILGVLWMIGKINHHGPDTPATFPAFALWGLLTALLRFIPYIGIWISSLMPLALSVAVYPQARVVLETFFAFGTVEVLAANFLEPMLYGSSTGIGTLAVLVAAAFWTWLWGPVGLLLSTPLTVCLVVMGKYVPQLEFLTVLLAEEPALTPPDRIYQRLLALDHEEANELVQEYARKMPLDELYDTVLVPALSMAEQDLLHGTLDEQRHASIQNGVRNIVDELGDQMRVDSAKSGETPNYEQPTTLPRGCSVTVACLPANGESDAIAAMMLGQLLEIRGYCVTLGSVTQLVSEMIETVKTSSADVVCISALPPAAITHARYLCKRMHGKLPEIEMLVGLWATNRDLTRARERIASIRSVHVTGTFKLAVDEIHQLAQPKLLASGTQT